MMADPQLTREREGETVNTQRFKFIHRVINRNARRKADEVEHERLKKYYADKLRGPSQPTTRSVRDE